MGDVGHPVVLFDGVCNLCNAAVNFIIDRDSDGLFRFAAIQSEAGTRLLVSNGEPVPKVPQTILLIEGGHVYVESTAALQIARRLRGPWKAAAVFLIVPRPIRDLVYRFIARNRYNWFGQTDACRVPTPELVARFL